MRIVITLVWLLVPVALLAWHFGPGQESLARDRSDDYLALARQSIAEGDFRRAVAAYDAALAQLPADPAATRERNQLGVAQGHARIWSGDMIGGQEQLATLIETMEGSEADGDVLANARHELATASYYCAWLMRLEGAAADEWKPEAERARQQYRLLAEETGDLAAAEGHGRNLEATIRLEQMDLGTLAAKPLPKNCPCCCKNLSQKKRKQCQGRCKGKKPGKKKEKQDVRKKLKGAGLNEREEGGS